MLPFLIGVCIASSGNAPSAAARSQSDRGWHSGKVLSVKKFLNNAPYSATRYPQIHYYTLFIGLRISNQAYCAEYTTPILDEIDDVVFAIGMDLDTAIKGKRLRLRTQNGRKLNTRLVDTKRCLFTTPELHGTQSKRL